MHSGYHPCSLHRTHYYWWENNCKSHCSTIPRKTIDKLAVNKQNNPHILRPNSAFRYAQALAAVFCN